MRDDERRQRLEEHLDDVDRRTTRIGHPIKARIDERPHRTLDLAHTARCHLLADKPSHRRVVGWIHHHDGLLTGVEHRHRIGVRRKALSRRERLRIAHRAEHIGETRQHVKIGVVTRCRDEVHRRLVAQSPVVSPWRPPCLTTAQRERDVPHLSTLRDSSNLEEKQTGRPHEARSSHERMPTATTPATRPTARRSLRA